MAVLGGLLTWLAFPDAGWWPLAVVGVALQTFALTGRSTRAGAGLGLLYGLALFVPLLRWSGVYVGVAPVLRFATADPDAAGARPDRRLAGLARRPRLPRGPLRAVLVSGTVAALWV